MDWALLNTPESEGSSRRTSRSERPCCASPRHVSQPPEMTFRSSSLDMDRTYLVWRSAALAVTCSAFNWWTSWTQVLDVDRQARPGSVDELVLVESTWCAIKLSEVAASSSLFLRPLDGSNRLWSGGAMAFPGPWSLTRLTFREGRSDLLSSRLTVVLVLEPL